MASRSVHRIIAALCLSFLSVWVVLALLNHPGSAALTQAGDNLLLNPGFDEPGPSGPSEPADWTAVVIHQPQGSPPRLERVTKVYVSSPASARIWHPGRFAMSAWESKSVLVEAGEQYSLHGHIRTQSLDGVAYLEVTFLNEVGDPVGQFSTSSVSGKSDWTEVGVGVRSPAGTMRAQVRCRVDGAGIAWFDDVVLQGESWSPPILYIEKESSRTAVEPGGTLLFTLTWSNVGGSVAAAAVISDRPAYLDLLDANPPAQEEDGAWVWEEPGPIQEGEGGVITIQARLTNTVPPDVLTTTNCARIASPEAATITSCVTVWVSRASTGSVEILPVESHHDVYGPDLPQVVTFLHTLTNTGAVPEGVVFDPVGPVDWGTTTPTLPYTVPCCIYPGEYRTVPLTVEVHAVPPGEMLPRTRRLELQVVPTTTVFEQARIEDVITIHWEDSLLPFMSRQWPPGLCNGDLAGGFTCWEKSRTQGQPCPELYQAVYGDAPPSAVLGAYKLGDTGSAEIVPVGCSILQQENVPVPNTSSPALMFKWQMITYDILCNDLKAAIDSLDVYVNDTLVLREGNPCVGTSAQKHAMDWCPPTTVSPDGWRSEVVSLAPWKGTYVKVTFELCNRDYADDPDYDLYNSWAFVDDVRVAASGLPTQRCWQWTTCPAAKCTP